MGTLKTTVRFTYNGKTREGTIDARGIGPAGEYITLKLEDGSFKSFTVSKMVNYAEVAFTLG